MSEKPRKTRTNSRLLLMIGCIVGGLGLIGCASDGARTRAEGQRLFQSGSSLQSPASTGWAVALAVFTGEGRDERASQYLAAARSAGLGDATRIERRGERSIVVMGSFERPQSPDAQRALRRAKEAQLDGRPFAPGAVLMPPAQPSARSEFDLSTAREGFAPGTVLYTLQIGLYGNPNGSMSLEERREARAAAERAAASLRSQGELAFVHHADRLSTVSVGVFREDQIVPGGEIRSLLLARDRHPYTLLNGEGVRAVQKETGQQALQPSLLVRIPG